jgi:hypothetical protein
MHRVRGHCVRGPRGGADSDGSPVDGARQGRRRKHPRSAAKAPGKRKRGGVHPSGGVSAKAVADVRDERALVSGGAVLRLEVEAREVVAARRQSGEGESWPGGERTRPAAAEEGFEGP